MKNVKIIILLSSFALISCNILISDNIFTKINSFLKYQILGCEKIGVIHLPDTLTVGPNHDFSTIQAAVNAADPYDDIIVYPGTYDYFSFSGIDHLDIWAFSNYSATIDGDTETIVVDMDDADYSTLTGFNITGTGDYGINCEDTEYAEVRYNDIELVDTGIYIMNSYEFKFEHNEIHDTENGIHIDRTSSNSVSAKLDLNEVFDNDVGLQIDNSYGTAHIVTINSILLYDNTYEGISFGGTYGSTLNMDNSTITGNDDGIGFQSNSSATIVNSIVYGNTSDSFTGSPSSLSVTYSCIEDGYTGTGNTDEDPYFCMEYNYEYRLMEGSPCIDTGDPAEEDSDDTRLDMGYHKTTFDIKPLEGNHWNWVSFPRLDRDDNDPVNAPDLLDEMISMPDDMTLESKLDQLTYNYITGWSNEDFEVISSTAYKLDPEENGDFILPEDGSRLSAGYSLTLYEGIENWIGYWLPITQAMEDAIPKSTLDHITSIEAEDWYAYKVNDEWMGWGTEDPTFVYGKGYIMEVDEDIVFSWEKVKSSKKFSTEKPEYFTFDDKPSYEMIDIESIEGGENIFEIGVFQDETCVGASKVDGYPVHIMAYTDAVNRSDELSFVVYTGRSQVQHIKTVLKYNFETGEYERTVLHPRQDKFSLLKLQLDDLDIQEVNESVRLTNYPNPFLGETTISFSVPSDMKAGLSIYNLKGQKIKTISSGKMSRGDHQTAWDGTDQNNIPVSSGIYMYRLETPIKTISRKLILMR